MPIPQWTFSISDTPGLAPADYFKMEACVQIRSDANWPEVRGTWIGSGFQVKDLPGAKWYHSEKATKCGNCKSKKTDCIYLYAEPAQSWIVIDIELKCKNCGKYTHWNGED